MYISSWTVSNCALQGRKKSKALCIMMPTPFNNCFGIWIIAPANKFLWNMETKLDMILIPSQMV